MTSTPDGAPLGGAERIELATSDAAWIGTFPGAGTVHVGPDGGIEVRSEPDAAPGAAEMLRWTWGEPLSFLRRGALLLAGTALASPSGRGLLVAGGFRGTPRIAVGLLRAGWTLVADGLVPVRFGAAGGEGGGVELLAREAPLVLHRQAARELGVDVVTLRGGGMSRLEPPAPRAAANTPLRAVLWIDWRGDLHRTQVAPVSGMDAWPYATGLLVDPVGRFPDPAVHAGQVGALARIPLGLIGERVCIQSPGRAADEVLAWWETAVPR